MSGDPGYLGIDLGTSGLKLTLVGSDGTVVAEAEETYELEAAQPGYAEIDPHDWSRALDRCVDRLPQTPGGGHAGAPRGRRRVQWADARRRAHLA